MLHVICAKRMSRAARCSAIVGARWFFRSNLHHRM